MRKITPRFFRSFCVFLTLLLSSAIAYAQTGISGKVMDANGAGLAGITVTVKGTSVATATDADGNFSLSVPAGGRTLVISGVGFQTQELAIGSQTTFSIALQNAAASNLNEVVIVGYGTARKKDLTGAVSVVSSKDFQKGVIGTPEQMIAGKVPGVSIISNNGQPGSGSQIRIRGGSSISASNDPLIVLDGVLLDPGGINGSANALSLINPNDIESFTVLKDASATAIYGSRASNGVIIITTKKGKAGALKVNFTTILSLSTPGKQVEVYTADELKEIVNNFPASAARTKTLSQFGTANTNWQDQIFRNAISTDNNISVSGGLKKLPYRVSLGYSYLNGVLKTDHLQRTALGLSLSPTFLNDHLKVDLNVKGIMQDTRFGDYNGSINNAVAFDPSQSVLSGNPRYGGYFQWLDPASTNGLMLNRANNPVGVLEQKEDLQKPTRSIGNIQFDYKFHFLPALRANLNLGYDIAKSTGTVFITDSAASSYSADPANIVGGSFSKGKQTKNSHFVDFYLNYTKDIPSIRSRVDATAGYSYNYYESKVFNYRGLNARKDTIPGTTPPLFPFDKQNNATIGYFGRLIYTLAQKYTLTATLRYDGSSRFAENNRWGYFPSAAFAWRISEEGFLKNSKVVSDLKLRVGAGRTGQQEGISNYSYFYGFNQANAQSAYQMGQDWVQGQAPTAYNPNLTWELTDTYNAAIDYGFLNNRISGSIDFYLKKTTDLLFRAAQPAGTNFSATVLSNVGDMENKGVEFNLNAGVIRKKDFTWDVNFNFTYNKNKITKLTASSDPKYKAPTYNIPDGGTTGILIQAVGHSLGSFYIYRQVYDDAGKPIEGLYEDINRDGIINENDRYLSKTGVPDVLAGFSSNFSYKKWTAGFVLRGSFNNYVYNNVYSSKGVGSQVIGGYHPSNMSRNFSETGFMTNQYLSDYYLENGSFVRMDNLNVGYTVGKIAKGKANLRVNAMVQNVFIITKYKGLDPEVNTGIDKNLYPRPRVFSLGANLDF